MYDLKPKAVFAHRRVYENPLAVKRMERMLNAMGIVSDAVPVVTAEDVEPIIQAAGIGESVATEDVLAGGHGRVRQGREKVVHDPVMLFNTFVWDEHTVTPIESTFRNPRARIIARLLGGVGRDFAFSHRELTGEKGLSEGRSSLSGRLGHPHAQRLRAQVRLLRAGIHRQSDARSGRFRG